MSQFSQVCVVILLLASMFLFALNNTFAADVQPNIIETFGDVEKLPWVSVTYALGAVATNLFIYGFMSKRGIVLD